MAYTVSVREKTIFLQHFLNHYELKSRESKWLLKYILRRKDILERVHFVMDVTNCPRAMMLATTCSEQPAFQFYKEHVITTNHDKAYHDIRFHSDEPLYIQLHYERSYQCPKYVYVVEENPYLSEEEIILPIDEARTERLLRSVKQQKRIEQLEKEIDLALDDKDKTKFLRLTNELAFLKKQLSHNTTVTH